MDPRGGSWAEPPVRNHTGRELVPRRKVPGPERPQSGLQALTTVDQEHLRPEVKEAVRGRCASQPPDVLNLLRDATRGFPPPRVAGLETTELIHDERVEPLGLARLDVMELVAGDHGDVRRVVQDEVALRPFGYTAGEVGSPLLGLGWPDGVHGPGRRGDQDGQVVGGQSGQRDRCFAKLKTHIEREHG